MGCHLGLVVVDKECAIGLEVDIATYAMNVPNIYLFFLTDMS